jgi:hypothetical protein
MLLWEFVRAFKPPRTIELDFPLGATLGRPNDAAMQREVLRQAFAAAPKFGDPWSPLLLPVAWSDDGDRGWEEFVKDLYRNDKDETMPAHQAQHRAVGDVLAGNEAAFIERYGV